MGPYASLLLAAALFFPAALRAAEFTANLGDANPYTIARLVVDANGNTYAAGSRTFNLSLDPFRPNLVNGAFVTRLDAAGRQTGFATVSGKGNDGATSIAIDGSGYVYVAGRTSSPDLPVRGAMQATPGPGFIAKFSADLGQLLYCTYFPAGIEAMAVDNAGNMYVTGMTNAPAFPVTPGLPAGRVTSGVPMVYGAFITKIVASGDRMLYSTLLAGGEKSCGCCSSCFTSSRYTGGVDIAVDPSGGAYVTGNTDTLDLPTTPGAMVPRGPGAFVAKVNAAGTALAYLTYLGTGNLVISPNSFPANHAGGIAVDPAGNAYVVGSTFDPQFPATAGAYQGPPLSLASPTDAFVIKLNAGASAPVWATCLGGAAADMASSVTLDRNGGVWIAGTTQSTDFPNTQGWTNGREFIVQFNASGSALSYAARYPDGSAEQLALDPTGLLHIGGSSGIVSALATPRPAMRLLGITNAAAGALGGRLAPGEAISIYGPHIGPAPPVIQPNTSGRVPRLLGGVQVFINDIAAPLLYVSDSQINAVVPFGIAPGTTARVRTVFNGVTSPELTVWVLEQDPQIFQTADGHAAAVNQDGTVNSADHPALSGSSMSIWVTGTQLGTPAPIDGEIAAGAKEYQKSQVLLGGTSLLYVDYAGAAPGIVAGVTQINFRLPAAPNSDYIAVMSGGTISKAVQVFIRDPE